MLNLDDCLDWCAGESYGYTVHSFQCVKSILIILWFWYCVLYTIKSQEVRTFRCMQTHSSMCKSFILHVLRKFDSIESAGTISSGHISTAFLTEKAGHDGNKHVRSIRVSCNGIQEQEQNCGQQTAIRSVSTLPGVALRHYGEELLHSRRVSPARVLIHPLV